jgi:hypothetical protein
MLCRRHGPLLLLLLSGAVAASVAPSSEVFIAADVASDLATDDPVEDEGPLAPITAPLAPIPSYTFPSDASILWNNGPFVTSPTGGASGNGLSALESTLDIFGFNVNKNLGFWLADDFNVTHPAGWSIGGFTFYAYQTGSGTTSTFTNVNVRIWKGTPVRSSGVISVPTHSTALLGPVCTALNRLIHRTPSGQS